MGAVSRSIAISSASEVATQGEQLLFTLQSRIECSLEHALSCRGSREIDRKSVV